jgi:hypothetical protein
MKVVLRSTVGMLVGLFLIPQTVSACFDTYVFLQKSSLVYPEGQMVMEISGDYIVPKVRDATADFLSGGMNMYYGFSKRFSMQAGVTSSEKDRSAFSIHGYGVRGVYGILQGYREVYNLDAVLDYTAPFDGSENSFEFSTPNIFHVKSYTFVVHPVWGFGRNVNFSMRGHGGAFYHFSTTGIIGIGAEYASGQSGSQFGQRLVKGEAGTSLFFGSQIGSVYLQNEFIKGWGVRGNDFGFAATMKFILPSFNKR